MWHELRIMAIALRNVSMRRLNPNEQAPYRIETAVSVWDQLASVPQVQRTAIDVELGRLAAQAAELAAQISGPPLTNRWTSSFDVDGYHVEYEVTVSRGTLTLLSVTPRQA